MMGILFFAGGNCEWGTTPLQGGLKDQNIVIVI